MKDYINSSRKSLLTSNKLPLLVVLAMVLIVSASLYQNMKYAEKWKTIGSVYTESTGIDGIPRVIVERVDRKGKRVRYTKIAKYSVSNIEAIDNYIRKIRGNGVLSKSEYLNFGKIGSELKNKEVKSKW